LPGLIEGHDLAADPLRHLGDYGVAEGSQSVHPMGNPMSASTNSGFSGPVSCGRSVEHATAVRRFIPPVRLGEVPGPPVPSDADGVGHDEHPVTEVRGTKGGRWNARPLCIVPEFGQVPEDLLRCSALDSSEESGHVLHEDVAGSKLANKAGVVGPEPAGVRLRLLEPGVTDGLAGESSGDDVDGFELGTVYLLDVPVAGNVGPMLGQHALAVRVVLDLPAGDHAGPLQT